MTWEGRGEWRWDELVFVNCPFDDDFLGLLHALLFTIYDCGFGVRIALQTKGSREQRLDKIGRMIDESRLSIHDISRVPKSMREAPRFNMPFECGLARGSMQYGQLRDASLGREGAREMLVLCGRPYEDRKILSDLAGLDPIAHEDSVDKMIGAVRHFLDDQKTAPTATRGQAAITKRYEQFREALAHLVGIGPSPEEIVTLGYLRDWLVACEAWLEERDALDRMERAAPRKRVSAR